ncbi:unnamed protein product, partial [Musa hybrid cultivar]
RTPVGSPLPCSPPSPLSPRINSIASLSLGSSRTTRYAYQSQPRIPPENKTKSEPKGSDLHG